MSSKSTTNREVCLSPNPSNTGTSRKHARNHDEQQNGEHRRRSCSQGRHQTPDETYGEQSEQNTIKCDVQHSGNPSSDGQSRNSPTHPYVQVSGDLMG